MILINGTDNEVKKLNELIQQHGLTVVSSHYNTDNVITKDGELVCDTNLPVKEVCYRIEEYFRQKRDTNLNKIIQ